MQLETFEKGDGRRVRLTAVKRDSLLAEYDSNPRQQIALALMARCGYQSQEAVDVRPTDVVREDEIQCRRCGPDADRGGEWDEDEMPGPANESGSAWADDFSNFDNPEWREAQTVAGVEISEERVCQPAAAAG